VIRFVAFDMDGTLVDVVSSWAAVHEHFGESNDESVRLFMTDQIDDVEFPDATSRSGGATTPTSRSWTWNRSSRRSR